MPLIRYPFLGYCSSGWNCNYGIVGCCKSLPKWDYPSWSVAVRSFLLYRRLLYSEVWCIGDCGCTKALHRYSHVDWRCLESYSGYGSSLQSKRCGCCRNGSFRLHTTLGAVEADAGKRDLVLLWVCSSGNWAGATLIFRRDADGCVPVLEFGFSNRYFGSPTFPIRSPDSRCVPVSSSGILLLLFCFFLDAVCDVPRLLASTAKNYQFSLLQTNRRYIFSFANFNSFFRFLLETDPIYCRLMVIVISRTAIWNRQNHLISEISRPNLKWCLLLLHFF